MFIVEDRSCKWTKRFVVVDGAFVFALSPWLCTHDARALQSRSAKDANANAADTASSCRAA
jgi:hypothetical protein